jgi:hypothetical protein
MITFELKEDPRGNWVLMIKDGQEYVVPCDEGNTDYQRYLRWLENPDAQ